MDAVLTLITLGSWLAVAPAGGPSDAELARIEADLDAALALLSQTIAAAERITVQDVIVGETAPALRHLPLTETP